MGLFALILILWGSILDLTLLFALPLMGRCDAMGSLIKFTKCINPLSMESRLAAYLFGACGVCRLLGGLYSNERGAWFACMGSMVLEIAFNIQVFGPTHEEMYPIWALAGGSFVYMLLNIPPEAKAKAH